MRLAIQSQLCRGARSALFVVIRYTQGIIALVVCVVVHHSAKGRKNHWVVNVSYKRPSVT